MFLPVLLERQLRLQISGPIMKGHGQPCGPPEVAEGMNDLDTGLPGGSERRSRAKDAGQRVGHKVREGQVGPKHFDLQAEKWSGNARKKKEVRRKTFVCACVFLTKACSRVDSEPRAITLLVRA